MKYYSDKQLLSAIRIKLILFISLLVLSGLTAFPLETELQWVCAHASGFHPFIQHWLSRVYDAIRLTNMQYPFLAYGTDWLAFAHLVIAVVFIGPYKDPVRNIWVIQFGMIACVMVFPLAFIAGAVRGIPFTWQLIDCSFGVFGLLLLYNIYVSIKNLELKYNQLY